MKKQKYNLIVSSRVELENKRVAAFTSQGDQSAERLTILLCG